MADLHEVLTRFIARYRAAVLTQAGLLAVLGMAVLGASAWRLRSLQVPSVWSLGAPMALAAAVAVGLGWWVRRHWLSPCVGAAHLDRLLGLQQRLVTAEEFADAAHPSPLYPLLVEDAAGRCEAARPHLPKPLTSASGFLALVLLLLLLWPHGGRVPMRLAQQPAHPSPPSPSPSQMPPPGPPSEQSRQQQQQDGGSGQNAASSSSQDGASGSGQQPQGGSPSSGGASGQQDQQQQQAGGSSGPSQHQRGTGQEQAQGQGQGGPSSQSKGGGQENAQQSQAQAQSGTQGSASQSSQQQTTHGQSGQQHATSSSGERPERGSQHGAQPSGTSNRSGQNRQPSGAGQQDRAGASGASGSGQQQRAGMASGQSAGDQEALKGEIQQLLKEVSGELKQLQAQLDSTKSTSHPDAGTGTDPQLYEAAPTPLDPSGHTPLAIQLQTDTAEVKTPRPGSGAGRPSGTASSDAPQTPAEAAQLSEAPLEESSSVRQTVPPEYVGVFDRLHRQRTLPQQPSEAR